MSRKHERACSVYFDLIGDLAPRESIDAAVLTGWDGVLAATFAQTVGQLGGRILFDMEADPAEVALRTVHHGGGNLESTDAGYLLAAKEQQRLYVGMSLGGPGVGGIALAGVVHIAHAADELVQFRFGHDQGFEEEIIRFSKAELAIARRARLPLARFGEDLEFVIAASGRALAVWLNGALVYRGERSRINTPSTFVIDLLPSATVQPEVRLAAVVAAELPAEAGVRLRPVDEVVLRALAGVAAEAGQPGMLAQLLSLLDDFPALQDAALEDRLAKAFLNQDRAIDEQTWLRFLACCDPPSRSALQTKRSNRIALQLVKVEHLTVTFFKNPNESRRLSNLFFSDRTNESFHVLRDVSFTVSPGEILGVIGRNGSGKTTLLRTIMGLFPLATGAITVHGRPLLLRPGVGMREDLSGRENIISSALHLGMGLREAKRIVDDVVDFSELSGAIDRPYKYYSDGMRARLIFSVATAMTADILMLDELLGAGDISFQEKAGNRLTEFIGRARAIIVVEHGMGFIRENATKILLLDQGAAIYYGPRDRALDRYMLDLMSELTYAKALRTRPERAA